MCVILLRMRIVFVDQEPRGLSFRFYKRVEVSVVCGGNNFDTFCHIITGTISCFNVSGGSHLCVEMCSLDNQPANNYAGHVVCECEY